MKQKRPYKKKEKKTGRPKDETVQSLQTVLVASSSVAGWEEAIEGEVMEPPEIDRFGRPTVMTEAVKNSLMVAFAFGCSNREAALYAGIAESTLDNYNKKDPEFKDRCKQLKLNPSLKARMTLVKALDTNPSLALQYLERKNSDEFSIKIRNSLETPQPLTEEERAEIEEVLKLNMPDGK